MKIPIPKGFYEDKYSVTHKELAGMVTDLASKIDALEEDNNYNLEWAMQLKEENKRLEAENARLRCELSKLQEQLKGGIGA